MARLPYVHRHTTQLAEATARFQQGLRPLISPGLLSPLALTLAAYALFFGQGRLLAKALEIPVGIAYLSICLSVVGVITLLPISFSGLGTREAVLITLFAPLGLAAEQAVAYSLLFFLTFYVGGGIVGALGWQMKPLKERPVTT
jgi:uncharacterized membrane protein YbhN (UPF0104 family)